MASKSSILNKKIQAMDKNLREEILCQSMIDLFDKHLSQLEKTRPDLNSIKEGEQAPDFMLVNTDGAIVRLYKLLQEGPTVISFYRGSWCPFCSIELNRLQEEWKNIKNLGVNLIAISPQLPEYSLEVQHESNLNYQVLSDVGNRVADKFGITYEVPEELLKAYKEELNIDLDEYNGLGYNNKLPLPATYIIDKDGKVLKSYVNWNYGKRLDPQEIIDSINNFF